MKIKKDMMVKVVSGNFKGMTGKVLKVIPTSQRAIVEALCGGNEWHYECRWWQ